MPDGNVNEARKQLVSALGESSKSYFAHLKSWFCMKMTKEDFDRQARLLLPSNRVHLHNEFLLALLTKCQSLCQPADLVPTQKRRQSAAVHEEPPLLQPKVQVVQVVIPDEEAKPSVKARPAKSRKKSGRISYETRFQPMEPIEMPIASFGLDSEKPRAGYCARDNSLPDVAMIHGRILLASWDFGLDQGCDNESVELLLSATRTFLKKLLTALITTRKGYKVNETKFVHSVGQSTMNPWIHNSWKLLNRDANDKKTESANGDLDYSSAVKPARQKPELEAAFNIACTEESAELEPIAAKDLFLALQVHKNVIPCHTVYAVNMERISARLYHPDE